MASTRFTLLLIIFIWVQSAAAINYYFDSAGGNDSNIGTNSSLPWKNISKLNSMTLTQGTRVYLKCGSVWNGQQLRFNGSGTSLFPIVIDQYGTGAKPILHGNGLFGNSTNPINDASKQGVVYLYNQDYIEINNLEITNYPTLTGTNTNPDSLFFVGLYANGNNPKGADRRGIMVAIKDKVNSSTNNKVCNHIYLRNIDIHHVKGQLGNADSVINGAIPKQTGGIYFTVLNEATGSDSRFNDILVENCSVAYCENIGIAFDNEDNVFYPGGNEYSSWYNRRFSNVIIRNNIIHHIGKNGMIIRCTDETGLVERNVLYETALGTTGNTIFTARAKGTVLQYNEGYYNRAATQSVDPGNIDGSLYDPDFGSVGIIFQYSYSHDNTHGLYWGCNTRSSSNNTSGIPDPEDIGCTLRYSISQNDRGNLVYFNYASAGNEIYNNVFYIKSGLNPTIIKENSSNNHTYNFFNNIIYNVGTGNYSFGNDANYPQVRNILNNVFYGYHPIAEPMDAAKLTLNPLLVNPGSGTTGINSLEGYKLYENSPALNSGKIISNNGGFDFFGTALPSTAPNRGVYQGNGVSLQTPRWEQKPTIQVYPNPMVDHVLNIEFDYVLTETHTAQIISLQGQYICEQSLRSQQERMRVPEHLHGLYLLRVVGKEQQFTLKILIP